MPRECLSDVALGQRQEGFKGWQTAGLDAHKKPLMWPSVPVG